MFKSFLRIIFRIPKDERSLFEKEKDLMLERCGGKIRVSKRGALSYQWETEEGANCFWKWCIKNNPNLKGFDKLGEK